VGIVERDNQGLCGRLLPSGWGEDFLVRNGLALDYRQHSSVNYADQEVKGQEEQEEPLERRVHSAVAVEGRTAGQGWRVTASVHSPECRIKGNISRKGARI